MKQVFLEKMSESVELNAEGIDRISEMVFMALQTAQVNHKEAVRLRLVIEDIMGMWEDRLPITSSCSFACGERYGRMYIRVAVPGTRLDPLDLEDSASELPLYSTLLAQAGWLPEYTYAGGENRLILRPVKPQRISMTAKLGISTVLALLLGYLCQFLPSLVYSNVCMVSDRLFNSLTGVLAAIAGPMIFCSVCVGIINMGNVATLSRIGKSVLVHMIATAVGCVALTAVYCSFFIRSGSTVIEAGNSVGIQILDLFLDIVPSNIFAPFVQGNIMQVLFLSIVVGVLVLITSDRAATVRSLILQFDNLIQNVMSFIGKWMHIFVFVCFFSLMVSSIHFEIKILLKGILVALSWAAIIFFAYTAIVSIRLQVPWLRFIKKLLPAAVVGFSTGSSAAAMSITLDSLGHELGVEPHLSSFAVPIGQMFCAIATNCGYYLLAVVFAELYGISIDLPWMIRMVVTALLTAWSTAPTTGGGLAMLAALLTAAGVPLEAMAMVAAWELISNFAYTGVNVICNQSIIVLIANRLGLLDKDVLRN